MYLFLDIGHLLKAHSTAIWILIMATQSCPYCDEDFVEI